jgi:hypothetical protein
MQEPSIQESDDVPDENVPIWSSHHQSTSFVYPALLCHELIVSLSVMLYSFPFLDFPVWFSLMLTLVLPKLFHPLYHE